MARTFVATRVPIPPAPLAAWLERSLSSGAGTPGLLDLGLSELDAARTSPGRVRDSAFHLLAADALLTYACEAALEADDPREGLVRILQTAAAHRL